MPAGDLEVVHRFAQVGRDRDGAGDGVEQDVPLRAERHQHDPAEVQADMRGNEERGEEREQEVRGEAREDLHDRLREASQARRHSDLDADRHPDQRRDDDDNDDAREGDRAEAEGVHELAKPDLLVDVAERLQRAADDDDRDDDTEHRVARAPARHIRDQRSIGDPEHVCRVIKPDPDGSQRPPDQAGYPRSAQRVEDDAARLLVGFALLDAESFRPRDQRPPEQEVHAEHHDDHHDDGQEHVTELTVLARGADVAPDARQHVTLPVHRDQFRRGQEEPAAAEAHHPVPDESDHRAGNVELPEPLPLRQPHEARRFVEVGRLRDERVVEAERHVPRLRREDREDRRELQTEDRVREQRERTSR